jgi:hypothetical protein
LLEHVGILWYDSREGVTWSGRITLPRPLPAGVSLKAVAVPRPLRSKTKEKYDLHLEIPLPEPPPEPPGPEDIRFKGELMSQWFRPPRPPGKRYKIMFWGKSGSLKTKSALEFPRCAYLDNHGSAENYEADYPEHLFFPPPGELATIDNTMAAVTTLLSDPGDRLTCVLDDATTAWEQIQAKWSKLFLTRLPKSKGHHAEFYTFQPSDWVHPKRENRALIRRLLALDMNVIVIARAKKEYAGASGDSDFMKVVGEIFAGEPNLVYEFDYVFKLDKTADGKYFAEISHKQRVPAGGKPFPERFEFGVDARGRSTFFQIFQQYADVSHFTTPAHAVRDLVKEDFPAEESPAIIDPSAVSASSHPQPGSQPDPPPATPAPAAAQAANPEIMVTQDQLDRLVALKSQYKIENAEWGQTLEKFYHVTTAKALNHQQADHFINYLTTQRVPF